MSTASRLIGQAMWASGGQLVQAGVAMAGTVVLVRLLGVEAYGIYALGLLFTGFADVFVGGHTADVLVQRQDVTRRHERAAFTVCVTLALAAFGTILATADLAARLFDVQELGDVLTVMAVLPLLTGLAAVPTQLLVRRTRFATLATTSGACAVVAVGVAVALALSGAGVWSLVGLEVTRRVLSLTVLTVAAAWRPGFTGDRGTLREVLAFAMRRVENLGLTYISQHALPRIVIAQVLGPTALGFYAVARRLLDQMHSVLSAPAAAVAFPAVSRWQGERARLRALIASGIRLTTWVFWPAMVGLIVVAPALVPLMLGERWTEAVPMLQLLAVGSLRVPVASFNSTILVGCGRMRDVSLISITSIVVAVPTLALGVGFGLTGVAAALAFRQWALWPLGATLVWRASGFPPWRQLAILAAAALPSLLMAGVVLAVGAALASEEPLARSLVLVGTGLATYPLVWAACNPVAARTALRAAADLVGGDVGAARGRIAAIVGAPNASDARGAR